MAPGSKMNILVVDDRAEQRLSLAVALAELGQHVVQAASGRDALRELLHQEFAVILLDVNMPGLDGFETAALIRQRQSCEHTPIIFITAYSDDAHTLRGYSLGAVDFIIAPVEPDVLRTKVAVFVELFKKNEEVKRQAAALQQRAAQLHRLTEASLAINAELSVEKMLQIVTERAAGIIDAHQSVIWTTPDLSQLAGRRYFIALSDTYAQWQARALELISPAMQLQLEAGVLPVRRTQAELEGSRAESTAALGNAGELPMRGWLAAPLTDRDGRNLGVIQLSDKCEGEFSNDDLAILVQLAQMASIAIENIVYHQERESNRLKDEFLATLSHELRTPLQAMLTWAQMLRTRTLEPAAAARGLEVIERSAKAQAQLIEDLLDVSRIINNKLRIEMHALDVVKVVDAAVDAVRPTATLLEIEVDRGLDAAACQVSADPHRLQQIIGNLLSNAVKFTPKGGRVAVDLEQTRGRARIRVKDNGKGIAPEFLPHIFERFRQADSSTTRAQGGLGLGLFVAHRLVELHGGTIRAESAGEGKGATFTVELPIVGNGALAILGPAQPALIDEARRTNGRGLDGVRLVVVDDEEDARECLALVLRQYGALVTAVGSAPEALAAIERAVPDALLCDVSMPGEDGYSLMRKVRRLAPERGGHVPAAAVTAYARSEDQSRALAAGFDAHVPKPIESHQLAAVVKRLLRKSGRN